MHVPKAHECLLKTNVHGCKHQTPGFFEKVIIRHELIMLTQMASNAYCVVFLVVICKS